MSERKPAKARLPEPPATTALGRGWTFLLLIPFALTLGLLVLAPVSQLLTQSLGKGWSGYAVLFESPLRGRVLLRTLRDCTTSSVICVVLGFTLAWTIRRTSRRWVRTFFWAAILLPLWMNVTMKNYAWMTILARGGLLQSLLAPFGVAPRGLLFTPAAVVIGLVYTLLPFAALPILVALRGIPDSMLRAAESLGATKAAVLRSIVLPQIASTIFATAVLVYILAMGFYVTPLILGGPRSTFVASLIQDDMFRRFDRVAAASTSMVLVLLSLILIGVAIAIVGRAKFERSIG